MTTPNQSPDTPTAAPKVAADSMSWRLLEVVLFTLAATWAAWYYTLAEFRVTYWGFPLDDAWIHLQFARNLATGHGFSYNPGIPVAGSTAPLWTLVLAVPAVLGLSPVPSAKLIGLALTIVSAWLASALTVQLTRSRTAALLAGLAIALGPRYAWGSLSGMEVSLYTALALWTLLAYLRALHSGSPVWGLLAGLAGAARPEVFVLFPILAIDWTVRGVAGRLPRRGLACWAGPMAGFLLPAGAFVAVNMWGSGHPLPLTFYAKSYGMGTLPSLMEGRWHDAWMDARLYPHRFVYLLAGFCETEYPDLAFGAGVGALTLLGLIRNGTQQRGGYVLVAMLLLAPVLKGLAAPQPWFLVHEGRYLLHLLAIFVVVSAVGLAEIQRWLNRSWVLPIFAAIAIARLVGMLQFEAPWYASKVKNINDLQIGTAQWLLAETSPDARIATNDIGAIAYFGHRFIIDTEGLVTPEAIHPKRMRQFVPFLESVHPDLLVIFPEWYPEIASRTDLFHEVYRIHAKQTAAGSTHLVVYRTPWSRPEAAPRFLKAPAP